MANYSIPPSDSIIGGNPDGTGGIVVAPYPQYIELPSDYLGEKKVMIGEDVIPCRLTKEPNYIINESLTIGRWIKLSVEGEQYNCLVEAEHKVAIPVEYNDPANVFIIDGNDTINGQVVETPNKLELPFGYYPSTVLLDDVETPLMTDQINPVYIKNPLIIFNDDTLLASWPTIVNNNRFDLKRAEFLGHDRSFRRIMTRGITPTLVIPDRLEISSVTVFLTLERLQRLQMALGARPGRLSLSREEYLSLSRYIWLSFLRGDSEIEIMMLIKREEWLSLEREQRLMMALN